MNNVRNRIAETLSGLLRDAAHLKGQWEQNAAAKIKINFTIKYVTRPS